jgi:hypothetical protein
MNERHESDVLHIEMIVVALRCYRFLQTMLYDFGEEAIPIAIPTALHR